MSKIFYTSDQHFGHKNIIEYCERPFNSVEHMNAELIRLHNETVAPEDIVWHLGDFSLHDKYVTEFLPLLNGTHHLIAGNHDRCHPVHKKKAEKYKEIYLNAGFKSIALSSHCLLPYGIPADMSHFPYASVADLEIYEGKFLNFRPKNHFNYLLHGHIHRNWKKLGKMINVGVDVWDFKPVSVEQISALIAKGYDTNE